jgi:hypothetical protein
MKKERRVLAAMTKQLTAVVNEPRFEAFDTRDMTNDLTGR